MDNDLMLCPRKETMVYKSVCLTKCTHNPAECDKLRAAMKESRRHCVDCEHYGDQRLCDECLSSDLRTRPFWKQRPSDKLILSCRDTVGLVEAMADIPTTKEVKAMNQLKLF